MKAKFGEKLKSLVAPMKCNSHEKDQDEFVPIEEDHDDGGELVPIDPAILPIQGNNAIDDVVKLRLLVLLETVGSRSLARRDKKELPSEHEAPLIIDLPVEDNQLTFLDDLDHAYREAFGSIDRAIWFGDGLHRYVHDQKFRQTVRQIVVRGASIGVTKEITLSYPTSDKAVN